MEDNPTEIISSTHDGPEFVARDTIIKNREAEGSRNLAIPYPVVALFQHVSWRDRLAPVQMKSYQPMMVNDGRDSFLLTLHQTFLPSIVSTRNTGSYQRPFPLALG